MPETPAFPGSRQLLGTTLTSSLAVLLAGLVPSGLPAVTFSELLAPSSAPALIAYAASPAQTLLRFAPADLKPGEARAAVILIHGGGWTGGSPELFIPHAKYFASRGLVAFSVGYRLIKPAGPGLRDCIEDSVAAFDYIREHAAELGVDPAKIVVMGDSAGGHLAAAVSTRPPGSPLPAAAVLFNPIVDLTDPAWVRFAIGGPALEKPAEARTPDSRQEEQARELSPIFRVRPGLPPTLVMHGTDDRVVDPEQVKNYARAMADAGNDCRLSMITGARHAFIIPKYTAPEPLVVSALREADAYLCTIGIAHGEPTLEPSRPPAWEVNAKKKP